MASTGLLFEEFYEIHGQEFDFKLVEQGEWNAKTITTPEIEKVGLCLAGYCQDLSRNSVLLFGRSEMAFLKNLSSDVKKETLAKILHSKTPFVALSHNVTPFDEMIEICRKKKIPLLHTTLTTSELMHKLRALLFTLLTPQLSCHGSLVDIFGLGVLIQGDSAIGKSEAALGLIGKGHRLISDDIVKVRKSEENFLEGTGVDVSRHHMELRGIGIVNIARLYGPLCVMEKKNLDIVVKLEVWDDSHFYDRSEHKEKVISLLGIDVPYFLLPVKPGRDVVLLLETIALNYRLKILSARERRGKQGLWESNS